MSWQLWQKNVAYAFVLVYTVPSDLKDLAAYADKINISNHSYVTKAGWWIDPTTGGYLWLGGLDGTTWWMRSGRSTW